MAWKKTFKFKIIIPTVTVLVILVVALNSFLMVRFSALSEYLLNEELVSNVNSLKAYLNDSRGNSRMAAMTMAFNANAIQAIKERDTSKLLEIFTPMLGIYRINFFTICDSDGIVLARTHEPERFGDSIINQQNVKDALEGKVSTYFEEGTIVKVSVRTGSPIYDTDGTLIGVVSTGIRFDTPSEIDRLKVLYNSEISVFLGDTRAATTLFKDGQRLTGTKVDPKIIETLEETKREFTANVEVFGKRYKAFYLPLFNAHHIYFATFVFDIPETRILDILSDSARDGFMFGLIGLVIATVLLFIIISSITKPITKLSNDMILMANGDLNIVINPKGEDEINSLGRSFKRVIDILKKLLDGINGMISEHSRGNTDYTIDTSEFSGDYKTLAENILELVSISTNDHLTGLPNKHNFNNRLEWEWNRAIKEKKPISVLMVDVDNFGNYTSTFGQQQSDAALQMIAKTLKQTKHPADFASRWGSQKFCILLSDTDSGGALSIAEEIRCAVENMVIPGPGESAKATVSIGVSTQMPMLPGNEISNLISIADVGVLKAKEAGRNRVIAAI